ncbi:chitin deacetylase [Mortierella alpina]|uniref:Chitin deacetylase n=1 Tax=Mortierella alpina TaxID=64518 RepID=A0A9P6IT61_MORAP|nr:chitin deacetylase [Mortierella alpina]
MIKVSSLTILLLALAAISAQNLTGYPPRDEVPDVNSPQVQAWLKEIDLTGVPAIAPYPPGDPTPACPTAAINANDCIRGCQSCNGDDLFECTAPNTWGVTFDDGPAPSTSTLLDYLRNQKISASFFVMGSNVIMYPDILKREVAEGHHLASHTWSHHALTTLTNAQIVAEMKWTEKAVMDITGLRLKYMRPPYGEINNRVRFVLKRLGYVVVDWTGDEFDTLDWQPIPESEKIARFTRSLDAYAASPRTKGFYCLEHDITPEGVSLAQKLVPLGVARNISFASVAGCEAGAAAYQNSIATPSASLPGTATATAGTGPSRSQSASAGSVTSSVTAKVPGAASHTGGVALSVASVFVALVASILLA